MTTILRGAAPSRGSDRLSSLVHHWDAADRSLDALSGQVGTFVRATAGGAGVDALGRVGYARHSQSRWEMCLDPLTGRLRPGLRLDTAVTNLVAQSEDFGTTWAAANSPTRTAAAHTASGIVLDLIGDDSGSNLEGYTIEPAFTGATVKKICIHVRQSTSTSSVVRLRDTTAGADRLLAAITWVDGAPVVTMTTGAFVGQRALIDGVWAIWLETTSITPANTNQLQVYPATTAALVGTSTGTIYAGGVGAFSDHSCAYQRRAGGAVTLNAEALSWPFALPRRRVWLYVAFTDLGAHRNPFSGGAGFCALGDVGGTGLGLYQAASAYSVYHYVGGAGATALGSGVGTFRQLIELLVTMDVAGRPTLTVARDGAVIGSATAGSDPSDMTTLFTGPTAWLGRMGATDDLIIGGVAYHAFKVDEYGLGTPTLPKVRGYR